MKATRQMVSLCLGIGMLLSVHPQLLAQDIAKANINYAPANTQNNFRELNIGDRVPDVEFKSLLNYPEKKARLSDFKAKLIILDFWSSSCLSCITLFPHMQSLQEEFKGDLQIILVNGKSQKFHDTEPKIKGILDRINKINGKDISLPVTMNCDDLDEYFPWQTIPHEVWINGEGKVIAITGSNEVNEANIRAVLQGRSVQMHTKKDVSFNILNQSLSELVYGENSSGIRSTVSSVLIKGVIDGLGNKYGFRRDGKSPNSFIGWYITNSSLIQIYKSAFQINLPNNQIVIETKDASRFKEINFKDTSAYAKVFSYDLTISPCSFVEMLYKIQKDLEGAFHATVKKENKKLKCLIIKASPQLRKLYSKGGARKWEAGKTESKIVVQNYPVRDVLKELNRYSIYPIINETNLDASIDIELPSDLKNTSALIKTLINAGFEVKEQAQEMSVLVIADN